MAGEPFNYSINAVNPVDAMFGGMQFGQQQRQGEQNLAIGAQNMGLAASQEQRAQTQFGQQNTLFEQGQQDRATSIQAAMEAKAAAKKLQSDLLGLSQKVQLGEATSADFSAIAALHPELTDEMSKMWDGQTAERKSNDVANIYKAAAAIKAGKPEIAISMLDARAEAADAAGDKQEADTARALAAGIKADPSAGLATLGMLLQAVDEKASVELFGVGNSKRSVQSTLPYENGTTVTVFNDGTKEVKDAAGTLIEGQAALDAIAAAQANEAQARGDNSAAVTSGKLQTEIAMGGEAEATKEAGKQAIAKSGEAFDTLGKVNANIATIDTAISAIDAGANAGAIAKYFPNISASSAGLENAMNRLGLDVIASVTFGALSEGEMKVAMETAVPRNLDEPALKQWLLEKKAAQEKAADALYQAAVYLGKPGNTLAKWLETRGQVSAAGGPNSPPADPAVQGQVGGSLEDDLAKYGATAP